MKLQISIHDLYASKQFSSFPVRTTVCEHIPTSDSSFTHQNTRVGENQTELETDAYKAFLSSGEGILGFDKRQADKFYD